MNKPFIVAELGASHLNSFNYTCKLMEAAAAAGADAVKFQTYTPAEIAADVVIPDGPWKGQRYHDLYREGQMPACWYRTLFEMAYKLGLVPFSSPFSVRSVNLLEELNCPIYKIASPEIIHYPLIAAAAATGKPLIISTGMATKTEIMKAAKVAHDNGASNVTFLHCISAYPAEAEGFNMATFLRLKEWFPRVGLSDHSLTSTAAIIAAANGAAVIEKHFILNRADGGPDAKFSLEPDEFAAMVRDCRAAAKAMGKVVFGVRPGEQTSQQYRRSIWLVKPIKAGEVLTPDHLAILRPNYGLHPKYWDRIIGRTVECDLMPNTPMNWGYIK